MSTICAASWGVITLLTLPDGNPSLMPSLQDYVQQRVDEFGDIPDERKEQLQQVADFVRGQRV